MSGCARFDFHTRAMTGHLCLPGVLALLALAFSTPVHAQTRTTLHVAVGPTFTTGESFAYAKTGFQVHGGFARMLGGSIILRSDVFYGRNPHHGTLGETSHQFGLMGSALFNFYEHLEGPYTLASIGLADHYYSAGESRRSSSHAWNLAYALGLGIRFAADNEFLFVEGRIQRIGPGSTFLPVTAGVVFYVY